MDLAADALLGGKEATEAAPGAGRWILLSVDNDVDLAPNAGTDAGPVDVARTDAGPGAPLDASIADTQAAIDVMVQFNRGSAKSHSGIWRDLAVRKRKTEVDAQIAALDAGYTYGLLWVAAVLTMITGWDYLRVGIKHMD